MSNVDRMKRLAIVTLCPLILTACNAGMGGAGIAAKAACNNWPNTSYSRKDTAQTRLGNQFNNASRAGFCAGEGPGPTPPTIGARAK